MPPPFSRSRWFALLPLILLAAMIGLGLLIEAARYGTLLWATKLPVAILLVIALLKKPSAENR